MKRLLLASVSVLALTSAKPGLAASPPPFNWTGCYVGVHVGYGWGRTRIADTPDGLLVGFVASSLVPSVDIDTNGIIGGGQVGCDYQFATSWVVGVEGEFAGAGISGNADFTGVVPGVSTFHSKTDWLANVTGRLGYAWDPRWLVYVKGGAAWAGDKYDLATYLGTWAASETRSGWTVGGGLEWAFADQWGASFEYQFYDFGSKDVTFSAAAFGPQIENVKQQIHTVKFGINYRFGIH